MSYGPFEWHIEVCTICGCQLGPGIGSHTSTGRCIDPSHGQYGGIVVRVVAAPDDVQPNGTAAKLLRLTHRLPGTG